MNKITDFFVGVLVGLLSQGVVSLFDEALPEPAAHTPAFKQARLIAEPPRLELEAGDE